MSERNEIAGLITSIAAANGVVMDMTAYECAEAVLCAGFRKHQDETPKGEA